VVTRADCRKRSKVVFGSDYRLDVLFTIATSNADDLYPSGIAERSGVPAGRVGVDLKRLAEIGLLERREPAKGSPVARYKRLPSPLWDLAAELGKQWGANARH
jgi:predicted transcriptional regulator